MKPINLLIISTFMMTTLMHSPSVTANSSSNHYAIQKFLVDEANRQNVDPALALAIAKVESDFNPKALSHAGAKGIMQIMPATAKGVFGLPPERLFDAKTNITIGISFIKKLLVRYDQRADIALSHYNGGSAVQDKFGGLTVIPATRHYVNKVLSAREDFKYKAYQLSDSPIYTNLGINTDLAVNTNLGLPGQLKNNTMRGLSIKGPKQQKVAFSPAVTNQSKTSNRIKQDNLASVESFDKPLYEKVEQLRTLRLHNIMRTSKNQALVNNSAYYTDHKLAPAKIAFPSKRDIPLSDKRIKVLAWEKMFN